MRGLRTNARSSPSFRSNEACDRAFGSSRLCETPSPRGYVDRPRLPRRTAQNHITAGAAVCEARLDGAANGNRAGVGCGSAYPQIPDTLDALFDARGLPPLPTIARIRGDPPQRIAPSCPSAFFPSARGARRSGPAPPGERHRNQLVVSGRGHLRLPAAPQPSPDVANASGVLAGRTPRLFLGLDPREKSRCP